MNDRLFLTVYRDRFTEKELEVLRLTTRGMSQRAVALALGVSRSSVQSRIETATRRLRLVIAEEEAKRAREAAGKAGDPRKERAADRRASAGVGRSADQGDERDTGRRPATA